VQLTAAGCSDPGPRSQNQDSYFVDLDLRLLVVADGMGGHNAGEVASRMAVDAVVDFIRATKDSRELTWPFPFDPTRSLASNRLSVALQIANRKVHDAGVRDPERAGMGTTIVATLVDGDDIVLAHVGDTRAYCVRGNRLQQMTEDDTWLNAMLGAGAAAGAIDHPMRHILTSGIGMKPDLTPTLCEQRLHAGEHWLICTDGVHGHVAPSALRDALTSEPADQAAREIIQHAVKAGTTDNATAVVLNVA